LQRVKNSFWPSRRALTHCFEELSHLEERGFRAMIASWATLGFLMIASFLRGSRYRVAMVSMLPKIISFFCKRALSKRRDSAKETYNCKEPTNRRHPIAACRSALHAPAHMHPHTCTRTHAPAHMHPHPCTRTHTMHTHEFKKTKTQRLPRVPDTLGSPLIMSSYAT